MARGVLVFMEGIVGEKEVGVEGVNRQEQLTDGVTALFVAAGGGGGSLVWSWMGGETWRENEFDVSVGNVSDPHRDCEYSLIRKRAWRFIPAAPETTVQSAHRTRRHGARCDAVTRRD